MGGLPHLHLVVMSRTCRLDEKRNGSASAAITKGNTGSSPPLEGLARNAHVCNTRLAGGVHDGLVRYAPSSHCGDLPHRHMDAGGHAVLDSLPDPAFLFAVSPLSTLSADPGGSL